MPNVSTTNSRNNVGYTLIELLVVIVIASLLFGVGYANFSSYSSRKQLEGVTKQIMAKINKTQQMALSAERPKGISGCLLLDAYEIRFNTALNAAALSVYAICDGTEEYLIDGPVSLTNVLYRIDTDPSSKTAVRYKVLSQGTDIPSKNTGVSGRLKLTLIQKGTMQSQFVYIVAGGGAASTEPECLNSGERCDPSAGDICCGSMVCYGDVCVY